MSRLTSAFIVSLVSLITHASPDLSLLKDFVGTYPVLSLNSDRTIASIAQVFASESGIGYSITPLKGALHPQPAKSMLASYRQTKLSKNGNTVTQESNLGQEKVVIEYQKQQGFINIKVRQCSFDCAKDELELGAGGSSGQRISTEAFCDAVKGIYSVESANGIQPKPEAAYASVEKESGSKECVLTFPYCIPSSGTCDPGYLFLGFENSAIYQAALPNQQLNYTILSVLNEKPVRYTWNVKNGKLRFINYQYVLPTGETIVLEHDGKRD